MSQHHPLNCILPPYIIQKIIENGSQAQRSWAVQTARATTTLRTQRLTFAEMGGLALPAAAAARRRNVYTADTGTALPGRLLRTEGQPACGNTAADEAFDGAGETYDLFKESYNRDSIDGRGLPLDSTVHYQKGYDNAFWNGSQMVYGDGDEDLPAAERIFNRFTIALDVIGHELTHGITQYTAALTYQNQSGALNESMSDVFGSLVKQRKLGHSAAAADWIIGAGLFTANVKGVGLRSMKAPGTAYDDPVIGKDPQPAHLKDYLQTTDDNGGVHYNSGIPNHAFYITAVEIGGNAWDKAGQIWYAALTSKLQAASDFQAAANLTFQAAAELFGQASLEQKAVAKGWNEVGITPAALPADTGKTTNPGCLPALLRVLQSIPTRK